MKNSIYKIILIIVTILLAFYWVNYAHYEKHRSPQIAGKPIEAKTTGDNSPITIGKNQDGRISIIKKSTIGNGIIGAPKEADVGESFTLILKVSPGDINELLEEAEHYKLATEEEMAKIGKNTKITTALKKDIELMPIMSAALSGNGFKIDETNFIKQPIIENKTTTWSWIVTPEKSGVQVLNIRLRGEIRGVADGVRESSQQYSIKVSIGWRGMLESQWQWVLTTIGGLAMVIWKIYAAKSGKNPG